MKVKLALIPFLLFLVSGCQKQDSDYEKLKDKATVETQASNDVQNARAADMEKDLQTRYRFYQAVKNVYTGQFKIGDADYAVRLELVPSISIFKTARQRTIEEVTTDLNNLHLNSQIVIWSLKSELSASGCVFQETHPNLNLGQIALVNRECPNIFTILVGDSSDQVKFSLLSDQVTLESYAQNVSQKVLSGEMDQIDRLYVVMKASNNAQMQKFIVWKK